MSMVSESKTAIPAWREGAFMICCALTFVVSAVATALWCRSMGEGMLMPGGWTMSMAWMRMPGQSWPAAAAMFLAMWTLMMLAMMLPCLTPMLIRYRRGLRRQGVASLAWPTMLVAAGYLAFWAVLGAIVYPAGIALAMAEMRSTAMSRWVPLATAITVLLAGAFQLTPWKRGCLDRCRQDGGCAMTIASPGANSFLHGLRLGADCAGCCLGFMALLLVLGVMDWHIMVVVTIAIMFERIAPAPRTTARLAGFVILLSGLAMLARAINAS